MPEGEFLPRIKAVLDAGVRAVQIREKDLRPHDLADLCESVRDLARPFRARVLVNDRAGIVVSSDLDGVHLTESSMPPSVARPLIGTGKLIGVSRHDLAGAQQAERDGADFLVAGPIAPTSSKPAGHGMLSWDEFGRICRGVRIPVFALGGVTVENADRCLQAGAAGIAAISLWMEARDVHATFAALTKILGHL